MHLGNLYIRIRKTMYEERVKCKVLKVHYKVAKHKCDVHLGAHAHVNKGECMGVRA